LGSAQVLYTPRSQAPTLRNANIEVVQAWRAWYFLSREKR